MFAQSALISDISGAEALDPVGALNVPDLLMVIFNQVFCSHTRGVRIIDQDRVEFHGLGPMIKKHQRTGRFPEDLQISFHHLRSQDHGCASVFGEDILYFLLIIRIPLIHIAKDHLIAASPALQLKSTDQGREERRIIHNGTILAKNYQLDLGDSAFRDIPALSGCLKNDLSRLTVDPFFMIERIRYGSGREPGHPAQFPNTDLHSCFLPLADPLVLVIVFVFKPILPVKSCLYTSSYPAGHFYLSRYYHNLCPQTSRRKSGKAFRFHPRCRLSRLDQPLPVTPALELLCASFSLFFTNPYSMINLPTMLEITPVCRLETAGRIGGRRDTSRREASDDLSAGSLRSG